MLYRNDGHGLLTRVTTGLIVVEGANSAGCSWGDFDNDGFFDLFVSNINLLRNLPMERNFFYRNKGDGTFDKITNRPPVNEGADTYGAAWADYDNDGFLDLFVANDPSFDSAAIPENNFLYRNNGNSNRWLNVRLVGTVSNRAGIGAKVKVKAMTGGQDRWQLRQIASSDGRTGGSLEAHFGLGDATIIDTVRIEWPSGIVQELHGVSVNQHLTVTEPAQLQVLGPDVFRVQSWLGMAFEVQACTNLVQWSSLTTVTNLTGTLEFTDPDTANHLQRFYRTVLR